MKSNLVMVSLLLAACALLAAAPSQPPQAPQLWTVDPAQADFSIHGVRLGMTREQVEELRGPGTVDGEMVTYGPKDVRTFYGSTHRLYVVYDEGGQVESAGGSALFHRGREISYRDGELGNFGRPDHVAVAASPTETSGIMEYDRFGLSFEQLGSRVVEYRLSPLTGEPCPRQHTDPLKPTL